MPITQNYKKNDDYLNQLVENLENFETKKDAQLIFKNGTLVNANKKNFLFRFIDWIYKPKNRRIETISNFALEIFKNNKEYFINYPVKIGCFQSLIKKNPLLEKEWKLLKQEIADCHQIFTKERIEKTEIKQIVVRALQEKEKIIQETSQQQQQILDETNQKQEQLIAEAHKTLQIYQQQMAETEKKQEEIKKQHQMELQANLLEIRDLKSILNIYQDDIRKYQDTVIQCRSSKEQENESYVYSSLDFLKNVPYICNLIRSGMLKKLFDVTKFQELFPNLKYALDFSDYSEKVVKAMVKFC